VRDGRSFVALLSQHQTEPQVYKKLWENAGVRMC
jgi:hypothetical protein